MCQVVSEIYLLGLGGAGIKRVNGCRNERDGLRLDLPLETVELRQSAEVAFVCADHANAQPARAYCDERVIGQTALADFFVTVFFGEMSQGSARLSPVSKIWDKNPVDPVEIALQTLNHSPGAA
jgi:hypothetical protein